MYQLGGKAPVDLASQAADVHVDDVRMRIEIKVPYMLQQHSAGDDLSRVLHEIFEKSVLARLEFDQPAVALYDAGGLVEFEVTRLEHGSKCCRAGAPAECGDASNQLRKREWLDKVIVTAGIEPSDPIRDAASCCKKEHGGLYTRTPNCLYDCQTVETRKHAVDDHEVIGLAACKE